MQNRDGTPIDLQTLLEVSLFFPRVEVELNDDDEIVQLTILSRIDVEFEEPPDPGFIEQFELFGPVGLIDADKIVLAGPRFVVNARTKVADQNNRPTEISSLATGALLSVTPGAPDIASGSFDPTALRVQVLNPNRPPPNRPDIVVGHLISAGSVDSGDPHIELAGPAAGINDETEFYDDFDNLLTVADVAVGDFVDLVVRNPGFGEENPIALEVYRYESEDDDFLPPPDEDEVIDLDAIFAEEILVEAPIAAVDSDNRFLALEGERFELDRRVIVFDFADDRIDVEDLEVGDRLELDARPGGETGLVVTRIQVIDPAVEVFDRPGVFTGFFEDIVDDSGFDELLFAGPFFTVPKDADLRGEGNAAAELADFEEGDYVRVAALPPRANRGETLPVASKVRIVQDPFAFDDEFPGDPGAPGDPGDPGVPGGEEPFPGQVGDLRVRSSFPEDGDSGIPTRSKVELTLSGQVRDLLFDPSFDFFLIPEPLDFGDLEISANGRTVSAAVRLEEDVIYQLVLISERTGFHTIHFTTGASISASSITGTIQVPVELPRNADFLPGESFAVLLSGRAAGELVPGTPEFDDLVLAGTPLFSKDFTFENVPPGSYFLTALVGFDLGRGEFIQLQATTEEPVVVGEDEQVQVDLPLALPEPLTVVDITPAPGTIGVDLLTSIEFEFNKPAFVDPFDIVIIPPPEEELDFIPNEDFTIWSLEVELRPDTRYRVVLESAEDLDGGALGQPVSTGFATSLEAVEGGSTIAGRVILPDLPAAREFHGPVLLGLIDADAVNPGRFGFDSFTEDDVVETTIAFGPEFEFVDVPPGNYIAAAFVVVDVPRGFRPPDPRARSLPDFDTIGGRFAAQVLEIFDTIELFGFVSPNDREATVITEAAGNIEIFPRGQGKTRAEIMRVVGVEINGAAIDLFDEALPVVDTGDTEIVIRFTLFDAESTDGSLLDEPLDVGFTTGGELITFGSVAGTVSLRTLAEDGTELTGDDADVIDEGKVILFEVEDGELLLVSAVELGDDGSYLMEDILPGDYQVFAELLTASGQEIKALHDVDADGLADVITVVGLEDLTGIDVNASVVIATTEDEETGVATKTVAAGGNVEATVTIDLDSADGNQNLTVLSNVEAGQTIPVDVFVTGVTNLSGIVVTMGYDADVLEFQQATDSVDGVTNLLRQNGGLAFYLPPIIREPEVDFGGSILGATEAVAVEVEGEAQGFLCRFNYLVLDGFDQGAQVFVKEVILVSTIGQDIIDPETSAKVVPPVFEEQEKGPVSLDWDTTAEDQEMYHKGFVEAGSLLEVDVYLNFDKIAEGFQDLVNYSVTMEFDPDKLIYLSYSPDNSEEANALTAGGGTTLPLPAIVGERTINFGNALLNPTAEVATDVSGLVGRVTFLVAEAFTDPSETDVMITNYGAKQLGKDQIDVSPLIFGRLSTGEIEILGPGGTSGGASGGGSGTGSAQAADFNGDKTVNFFDLFELIDFFGLPVDENTVKYDLDQSGLINFFDIFIFVDFFNQAVSKQAQPIALPTLEAGYTLASSSAEDGLRIDVRSDEVAVDAFNAVVEFDPEAFRFTGVDDDESALRSNGQELVLVTREGVGEILLAGGQTGRAGAVEGLLASLNFEPLTLEATGLFRLRETIGRLDSRRGGRGNVVELTQKPELQARWVPQVFALHTNYPNPFNPSTTIRFQVPVSSDVRIDFYDALGQKVRTLVDDVLPAGYHQLVWDSRNEAGKSVAAGVYFYRMRAGDFTQVRKLLLLK